MRGREGVKGMERGGELSAEGGTSAKECTTACIPYMSIKEQLSATALYYGRLGWQKGIFCTVVRGGFRQCQIIDVLEASLLTGIHVHSSIYVYLYSGTPY